MVCYSILHFCTFFVTVMSLDCLLCKSTDLDSECRLGQRKYRPKISHCNAPNAKCFGLALSKFLILLLLTLISVKTVDENGIATVRRGCTIDPDYCQNLSNFEFCQTCGSKFCNYWIMDLGEQSASPGILNELDRDANQTKLLQ